jgi:hypothetical protein
MTERLSLSLQSSPSSAHFFECLTSGRIVQPDRYRPRWLCTVVPTNPQGRELTSKEIRYLFSGPDKSKPEGARDYAMTLVMLRLKT